MQLRYYAAVLRRFWVILVALPVVVALVSTALEMRQSVSYLSETRLMLTQTPHPSSRTGQFPDINLQYSWQSSQFILDDMPSVITSRAFAEDVSRRLNAQQVAIPPDMIQGALNAQTYHRAVTLSATSGSPQIAEAILIGAVETLQSKGLQYWSRIPDEGNGLSISVLNPPSAAAPIRNTTNRVLGIVVRTILALVMAIGIAFLLHYLDDTLHEPAQVEQALRLEVLGLIPPEPDRPGSRTKSTKQR